MLILPLIYHKKKRVMLIYRQFTIKKVANVNLTVNLPLKKESNVNLTVNLP